MSVSKISQEVLSNYQVRKTKTQKTEFIEFLKQQLGDKHKVVVEQSGMFKSRNIVVGDFENSKYILGAHYDTAPVIPFPNFVTPKNFLCYILYNILIILGVAAVCGAIIGALSLFFELDAWAGIVTYAVFMFFCWWMMFGKANKHTANDNTSGVITLLEVLNNEELRDKVCCVFFDHEEVGLIGSSAFASKHSKELKDKVLINFDCVGDGDHCMFILSKSQLNEEENIKESFIPVDGKEVIVTKSSNTIYPSDQANFKHHIGVAVLKKNKIVGYYLDKVHTNKDVNFDERNIHMLVEGLSRFVR